MGNRKTLRALKKVVFSLAAVALVLLAIEIGARGIERARPPESVDAKSPLSFQQMYENLPSEQEVYDEVAYNSIGWAEWNFQKVPVDKKNELRIILLGGSAVASPGVPTTASFPRILERLLNAASPGRRVRVINLARTGNASPQMAHILRGTIDAIEPDLVITVMGNNEFLDVAAMADMRSLNIELLSTSRWLENRLALARLLRPRQKPLPEKMEMSPLPNVQKNASMRRFVSNRLKRSVANIAWDTKEAGAETLICSVPVNLRFRSEREWFFALKASGKYAKEFSIARWALAFGAPGSAIKAMQTRLEQYPEDLAAHLILAKAAKQAIELEMAKTHFNWVKEKSRKRGLNKLDHAEQVLYLQALLETDGLEVAKEQAKSWIATLRQEEDGPLVRHQIGNLFYYSGDYAKAKAEYIICLDMDDRLIRADAQINRALLETASRSGATWFDLAGQVAKFSPNYLPGFESFFDYCHYNPEGHVLVAHLLAKRAASIFRLPGKIPVPDKALTEFHRKRDARLSDLPGLADWAGVDFDVYRLVDENTNDSRPFVQMVIDHMKKHGESALGHVFLANRMIACPETHDRYYDEAVQVQFLTAHELDPSMKVVESNLKYFEWLKK